MESSILTMKMRLRDKHAVELSRQSRAVNLVWNYCNETQKKAVRDGRKWLNSYDLQKLTAGAAEDLGLHSHTIKRICIAYDRARKASKKPWLRWRSRRSLGWIPFSAGHVTFDGEAFKFRGKALQTMHIRDEIRPRVRIKSGSFAADSRGRWYLNVPVEIEIANSAPVNIVGIDLGLKDLATLSTGRKIESPGFYRNSEMVLGTAQRARKTMRTRAIHAKVAARRMDFLHKAAAKITSEYGLIVVGDVSPSKIAKTFLAKSAYDAGWAAFKRMLAYKSHLRAGYMLEVSERWSTQVCSECGSLPPSRPKGIAGLGIREWSCDDCGAVHDRDVNAARNILRAGQRTLVEGAAL